MRSLFSYLEFQTDHRTGEHMVGHLRGYATQCCSCMEISPCQGHGGDSRRHKLVTWSLHKSAMASNRDPNTAGILDRGVVNQHSSTLIACGGHDPIWVDLRLHLCVFACM